MERSRRVRVRLIGGSHAGETHEAHADQAMLRLIPLERSLFVCAEELMGATVTELRFEEYRIEKLRFGDGHEHCYGVAEGMRPVDAFNAMWAGYRKEQGRR